MSIERINPGGLTQPTAYTQVVRATGGTTIYLAGQVAADAAGNVVGAGDFEAQARQVFANLRTALEAAGAAFEDVVKTTTYVVNYSADLRPALQAAREAAYGTARPASTLVGVQALAAPEYLIEVEAIAVLD